MNNKYKIGDKVMLDVRQGIVFDVVLCIETDKGIMYNLYDIENKIIGIGVGAEQLTPYIEEDTPKPKFNTDDKVVHEIDGILTINYSRKFGEESWQYIMKENTNTYDEEYLELLEDTQEDMLKFHNDQSIGSSVGQAPVGLDYEKEYYISMSKYAQTIEKLENLEEKYEGAKMAIKLLSELLPSKYEE